MKSNSKRKLLSKLAKSYQIPHVRIYNDARVKMDRYKFYGIKRTVENFRWFILRLKHDFPEADISIEIANHFYYSVPSLIIKFPKEAK